MNVEKKPDEGCAVKLIVKADAAEIADECKKVLNTFLREASIPGFRKGKVPLAVIQQKFADGIKQESEQACFRKLYPQALKEAAVEPIELTGVTDVLLDPATGFSFTAIVEVRPEFSLPKYKKLPVKAGDTMVKDELPVMIGTKRKFFCRPGTFGKKAAIQITRVAPEGDEETDE